MHTFVSVLDMYAAVLRLPLPFDLFFVVFDLFFAVFDLFFAVFDLFITVEICFLEFKFIYQDLILSFGIFDLHAMHSTYISELRFDIYRIDNIVRNGTP